MKRIKESVGKSEAPPRPALWERSTISESVVPQEPRHHFLTPPPLDSAGSVLDKFVVDAATAYYASVVRSTSHANSNITIDRKRVSLRNSFLDVFRDSRRFARFLDNRGEHAQDLIDTMQNMLDDGIVEKQFKVILAVALSRLVAMSELYPSRFILQDITRQEGPLVRGKSGFIGKGLHDGKVVCIKVLRLSLDLKPRSFHRALVHEMVPWGQLRHENVLPFYGLCRLANGRLGFVSPFLENGDVVKFLKRNPDTNRLSIILDVARGMTYLHENGVIHGSIKDRNILVTNTVPPRACLADFGLSTIIDAHARKSTDLLPHDEGGSVQFLAPELLDPRVASRRTKASDVYAFSMASYLILADIHPFDRKSGYSVVHAVMRGKRPDRPIGKIYQDKGLNDVVWQLIVDSWDEHPRMRPRASQIVERLSEEASKARAQRELAEKRKKVDISLRVIFSNIRHYKCLLSCNGDDAQTLLDAFQLLLDIEDFQERKQLIAAMRRLAARTELYPRRFFLHGPVPLIEDDPLASGNYADIYKITFQGEETCFKVIRAHQRSLVDRMAKVYAREVILWSQLSHRNILPFYGLSRFRTRISFVSPWADNGHLSDYLARNPNANRILLCLDTAAGIEYLHINDIVHGDLKGVNVLVDGSGRACLGDFGLSSINDPYIVNWASQSSMASKGGTGRWQAPELHEPEANIDNIHNSKESDVFAWANICYEIFTNRLPYFEAFRESTVIMMIMRGDIPSRPQEDDPAWLEHGLNDRIWDLMKDCWKFQPSERPSIATVISRLDVEGPNDLRPLGEWEQRVSMRFRKFQDINVYEDMLPSLEELDKILSHVIQKAEETNGGR